MGERIEALIRIGVGFVSGLIIGLWGIVAQLIHFVHWFYVIILGKRNKEMAEWCYNWIHEAYRLNRYMVFHTNQRPFPFTSIDEKGRKKFE